MAPPERTKRKYGLGFTGYQSSVAPHMAPPDKATSDGPSSATRRSQNFRYNPLEQKFYRREGTALVGASGGILENGAGELDSGARCRKLMSLRSGSLDDGYPTRCSLWTDETDHQGCVHFYSTNDNGGSPFGDTVLGDEFSTTTNYPITAGGGVPNSRAWPYVRTSDDQTGRFHSLTTRAIAAAGSRNMIEFSDRLYMPDLKTVPMSWTKEFNDTNTDTGSVLRVHHVGRPAPLGMPDINTGFVNASGPWHDADIFYVSVAYRYADGSVSMPIIPREPNNEVNYDPGLGNMTGFGRVQISAIGSTRYTNIVWSNIPIGPPGVVGRYLLRTPKNSEGLNETAAPADLRVVDYLDNNTQTTYTDAKGNDLDLLDDPLLVRFDHIMQPPARYLGTVDGRVMCGYTNPHPVALYIAPFVNVQDGDGSIDNVVYSYSLTGGTLTLNKDAGSTTITNIGDDTIQQLIDKINNTVTGGGGGKWFAVHAPGADLTVTCDDVGTAADNDNLVSITGATDFAGDGNGIIRAWGSSWPAPIFFSSTYLARFTTQKRRIFFTMGGPGMPSMAADSWAAGNYRTAPESYGEFVGSAPLPSGAVCCFSKGIMVLQNRKAGVSGEDVDYRLYDLNPARGCIAFQTIVAFNGAVGYMTADGFVVTDGRDEVLISGDVWNTGTQTGEWAYEITQSSAATGADTDLADFYAFVSGGKLSIHYRLNSDYVNGGRHRIEYDFTGSQQFAGLRGVLRPDGTPWGWSTPLFMPIGMGSMGEVLNASGVNRYAAMNGRAVGMTSSGRIYQIETGSDDDGTDFTSRLWTSRDFAESLKKKSNQAVHPLYKKNGTGLTLAIYRDGLGATADHTLTLATTSTDNFASPLLPLNQAAGTPTRSTEFAWVDDGSGTDAPQIWGHETDVLMLDSYD